MNSTQLILASGSPRRKELLTAAGYAFEVQVPSESAECSVCSTSGPAELVAELALRKAADVAQRLASQPREEPVVILAADTVADSRGQILGKPEDEDHARQILGQLSGSLHRVYSGVCLWPVGGGGALIGTPAGPRVEVCVTQLEMDPLTPEQLDEYLASGQWEGKAGAFGYQDRLGWVRILAGSESNVVGLPMETLTPLLEELGISPQSSGGKSD